MDPKPIISPYSKVIVEVTLDHPEWEGDGQDERLAVEGLCAELDRFLPATSYRIIEVETSGP